MKKFVYNVFLILKNDIEDNFNNLIDNIFINVKMFKFIFKFVGNYGWKFMVKKNNLKVKDFYK